MNTDKIISALIGLVGACGSNQKTENTDGIVLSALAFAGLHPDCSEDDIAAAVSEIHADKYAISPNCATCIMPCGNTSDYDMSRIYNAPDDIRKIKLDIISDIRLIAEKAVRSGRELPTEEIELIYRALAYVSYDIDKVYLLGILDDIRKVNQKTEG